jgi:hypothetical protein
MRRRRTTTALALGAAALSLVAVAQESPGPMPPSPEQASAPAEAPPAGLYIGPTGCGGSGGAGCHGYEIPRDLYAVNQDEITRWSGSRHQLAYETLSEERSRVIARNLGLGDPAEAPTCLACHMLSVPAAARRGEIDRLDGVSCEACHGPASGWRDGHTAEDWTYADSVAAGMIDLADLEVRTRNCLGCHLGEPGRRVDHDLIAAGHPALPFELRNFSAEIPEHWRTGPEERLREWAVGQPAALRTTAVELGRRARDGRWPDFSVMSCRACHHDLEEESYRSEPGAAGSRWSARIGLPPWSPARWAVLRVLLERYAPEELPALDRSVGELAHRVSRISTPPAEVAAAADDLAGRLAPLVDRMEAVEWRPAEARAVALALAARGDALDDDVDTASQGISAMAALVSYHLATRPASARSGVVEALTALTRTVERPEAYDPARFRSALSALGERFR